MKYLKIAFIFGLVLMISAGCSKEEIQPDPLNETEEAVLKGAKVKKGQDKDCITLHGTFHIYIDEDLTYLGPKVLRSLGEGNLIHLGKTEVQLIQAWLPIPGSGTPGIPPWSGQGWSTCNPKDSDECHVKFTTENGEFYAYYGSKPAFPPLPEYLDGNAISYHKTEYHVEVSLTGRITGGIGEFENATDGEFTWNVIYNPATNKGVAKIRGQINL